MSQAIARAGLIFGTEGRNSVSTISSVIIGFLYIIQIAMKIFCSRLQTIFKGCWDPGPNNRHQPENLHYAPFCVFAGAHFYTKIRSVTVSAVPGVMQSEYPMKIWERILRIVLTVLFVALGLWLLNHSIFSFWVSGGPPNNYPEIWYQQGIISGWRAIALLTLGVMVQFRLNVVLKSWGARVVVLLVLLGLTYPSAREFLLIDACLDEGGAWSKEYFKCQT